MLYPGYEFISAEVTKTQAPAFYYYNLNASVNLINKPMTH
jgi:hypothetical protein